MISSVYDFSRGGRKHYRLPYPFSGFSNRDGEKFKLICIKKSVIQQRKFSSRDTGLVARESEIDKIFSLTQPHVTFQRKSDTKAGEYLISQLYLHTRN